MRGKRRESIIWGEEYYMRGEAPWEYESIIWEENLHEYLICLKLQVSSLSKPIVFSRTATGPSTGTPNTHGWNPTPEALQVWRKHTQKEPLGNQLNFHDSLKLSYLYDSYYLFLDTDHIIHSVLHHAHKTLARSSHNMDDFAAVYSFSLTHFHHIL